MSVHNHKLLFAPNVPFANEWNMMQLCVLFDAAAEPL